MYNITDYSKEQARKLGVQIKPSKSKGKKLDVFKDDKKVASIGAIGYMDYGKYLGEKGKAYAEKRRELYKARHKNDMNKIGTAGWYASRILW